MKKMIIYSLLTMSTGLSAATIRITNSLSQPITATVNTLAKPLTKTIKPGKTEFYNTQADPADFISWKVVGVDDSQGWHMIRTIDAKQVEVQVTIKDDGRYSYLPCVLPTCRLIETTANHGMLPQTKTKPKISAALAEEL